MYIYSIVIRNVETANVLEQKPFAWAAAVVDVMRDDLCCTAAQGDPMALCPAERQLTTLLPTGIRGNSLSLSDVREGLAIYRGGILSPSIVLYAIDGLRMETGFFGAHVVIRNAGWPRPDFPDTEKTLQMFRFGWKSICGMQSRAEFAGESVPGGEIGLVHDAIELTVAALNLVAHLCKR